MSRVASEVDAWDDDQFAEDELAESVGASSGTEAGVDTDADAASADEGHDNESVDDVDERVALLRAPILSICSALGGYEHMMRQGRTEIVYRIGDDCLGT